MDWDALALVFICTAMNHMGLISTIEEMAGRKLPVVNCIKCSVFWVTLIYGVGSTKTVLTPVALAFMYSYIALWLELLMGCIDSIYIKCYEKIVSTAGSDTTSTDADNGDSADAVS